MTDIQRGFQNIQNVIYGDMLKNEMAAAAVAETLLRQNFGDEALKGQLPLSVYDEGQTWWVEGSLNRDGTVVGPGPIKIRLKKQNAAVEVFYFRYFDPSLSEPPKI